MVKEKKDITLDEAFKFISERIIELEKELQKIKCFLENLLDYTLLRNKK